MSGQIKPVPLSFYITPAHDCPYLDKKTAKTVFLSPEINVDQKLYTALIEQGFRRSGEHIYRPHCDNCNACLSTRVPVNQFSPNKQQRRCLKKSTRFSLQISPARFNITHYQLFSRYIENRHRDGDMYPASPLQFREFLLNDWFECNFLNLIDIRNNKLVSTTVFDVVENGLSAVYTFFDTDYAKFSPGRLGVLKLIQLAKQKTLDFVYLGYWIKDCQKMSYKGEYRPIECFVEKRWLNLS